MLSPHTKFDVSTINCYEDMKGNAKCKNCGRLGHSRSSAMSPFDRPHMTS